MTETKKKTVKKTAPKKETASPADRQGFAVIETGGKQYLVRPGDKVRVEKLGKPQKGTTVVFDKVLLVVEGGEVKIGTPYLKGAKIKAEWLKDGRNKKITNVKYKSKTRQGTKKGHRQIYTEVLIGDF